MFRSAAYGYERESPEICAPGEVAIKDVSIKE